MHGNEATSLLVMALGAFVIPIIASRVHIPSAVGEILFGIAVGPHALGLIHPSLFLSTLAEFGFALLMFIVGFELDFPSIRRHGIRGLGIAMASALSLFALALGATLLLDLHAYLALALAAVSLGIVMATLKEARLTATPTGQIIMLLGSIGEFLTILGLTIAGLYYQVGVSVEMAYAIARLVAVFTAAAILLLVLRSLIWWWPERFLRLTDSGDPTELGVRGGLATMLVFVALASIMGVESILGAFLAGALFAFVFREKALLTAKLSSVGFGFFVPIFFITVGTRFDLLSLTHIGVLPLLGLLFVASVGVKLLAALPLRLLGFAWRETVGIGLILATPLTLLVVISHLGTDLGLLDQRTAGALVLLAILTSVALPTLFRVAVGSSSPPLSNAPSRPPSNPAGGRPVT